MESNTSEQKTLKRKLEDEPKIDQNWAKRRNISLEIICKRFPFVVEKVLSNLNNQSLMRSKKASREINKSLENQRFYWIRIIKMFAKIFEEFQESWKEVMNKIPLNFLKDLAIAVAQYFMFYFQQNIAPLRVVLEKGNFELCQFVLKRTKIKNPKRQSGIIRREGSDGSIKFGIDRYGIGIKSTPLHIAAMFGKLEICRLIMDEIKNDNPKGAGGNTPLHLAAANGHSEVCKMMVERICDKNPCNGMR